MSSEDYLTRYFQQLGKVLAAIMGFRENKKYQQVIDEINQVLDTWFNLPEDQLKQLNAVAYLNEVMRMTNSDMEKIRSIAELLYQKSITFLEMKNYEAALWNAQRALLLFRDFDHKSGFYAIEIQQKITELDQLIKGIDSLQNN